METGSATKRRSGLSRVRMGLLIAGVFFGAAALGGWAWSALMLFSIWLGTRELKSLMNAGGIKPSQVIVYAAALLMVLVATLNKPEFLSPILTLTLIAGFFRLLFRQPRATIADIGGTMIVVFYMAYLPAHFILLRHLDVQPGLSFWQQPGLGYLLMMLAVISASDIAAYYVGMKFGRNLLAPDISPKKTREGAIGGLLGGGVAGILFSEPWRAHLPLPHAAVLSVLLVVVGQLGDLTESMMKRDVGMKDSGALFASHGGLLDRVDSYVFSGVVCYYYIYWIVLQQGLAPVVIEMMKQWIHLRPGS